MYMRLKRVVENNTLTILLVGIYGATLVWWISIAVRGIEDTLENYLFNIPMAVVPVLSGMFVIVKLFRERARTPNFFQLGTGIISGALIAWGMSMFIYLYNYIALNNSAPNHTVETIGYFTDNFFRAVGLFFLVKYFGAQQKARQIIKIAIIFGMPFVFATLLYLYALIEIGTIQLTGNAVDGLFFMDVFSLFPDIVIFFFISLLIYQLCVGKINRMYSAPIIFLVGFFFHYIGDVAYFISLAKETFYVGSWIDLMFFTGVFFQSISMVQFIESERIERSRLEIYAEKII